MTPSEFQQLSDRLQAIENSLAILTNPAAYVSLEEKTADLRAAIDSGDKAKIKAAKKRLNS